MSPELVNPHPEASLMEVEEPLALEAARNYRAVELQVEPRRLEGRDASVRIFHQFARTNPWDERYIYTPVI